MIEWKSFDVGFWKPISKPRLRAGFDHEALNSPLLSDEWIPQSPRMMSRKLARTSRSVALSVFGFFCLLWIMFYLGPAVVESFHHIDWKLSLLRNHGANQTQVEKWRKPEDLQVIGMVFYGRQEFASILECYLQKNLVQNGGILDKIIFVLHKSSPADIDWLELIVDENESYSIYDARINHAKGWNWNAEWQICEEGSMYIKIDDDVVFIDDSTIPSMVQQKYENPNYLLVSANTINSPALSWVHYHLGAVKPYLPELEPPMTNPSNTMHSMAGNSSWRPSELPEWEGPDSFEVGIDFAPPFYGHRWLPLPAGSGTESTPISTTKYDAYGSGWSNWTVAAQEHYSFLENLENNELWRYKFDTWDFHSERLSINMIAIMGDDVLANLPFEDDEADLTMKLTKKLGRTAVVNGNALAVHFGFNTQVKNALDQGVRSTDVLRRYRMYAKEFVCSA